MMSGVLSQNEIFFLCYMDRDDDDECIIHGKSVKKNMKQLNLFINLSLNNIIIIIC